MAMDVSQTDRYQWVGLEIGKLSPAETLMQLLDEIPCFKAYLESKAALMISINNIDKKNQKRRKYRNYHQEEPSFRRARFPMSFDG